MKARARRCARSSSAGSAPRKLRARADRARRRARRDADRRARTSSPTRSTRPSTRSSTASNKGTDVVDHAAPGRRRTTAARPRRSPPSSRSSQVKRARRRRASPRAAIFDAGRDPRRQGQAPRRVGAPSFVSSVGRRPALRRDVAKQGRLPTAPDEAAIDRAHRRPQGRASSATRSSSAAQSAEGASRSSASPRSGRRVVRRDDRRRRCTLPDAQRIVGNAGQLRPDPGRRRSRAPRRQSCSAQLKRGAAGVASPCARASRRRPSSRATSATTSASCTTALLVFAGISLFVGAFIIFNTFSITVAQRIARVRAAADARRLARARCCARCVVEGLRRSASWASLVGLALGLVAAIGLRALFKAVGVDLPSNGTRRRDAHDRRLAARRHGRDRRLAPSRRRCARRASPPVEALREGVRPGREAPSRRMPIIAALLTRARRGAHVLSACSASFRSDASALSLMGGGVAAIFLGVALLEPATSCGRWPRRSGGRIEALTGVTGRLARENTMRQPGRTAVTAAALMIGVALVDVRVDLRRGRPRLDRQGGRRQPQGRARRPERQRLLRRSRPTRCRRPTRVPRRRPASAPCASRRRRSRGTASSR